ncbi:hypothetical protein C0Q70_17134 [Pomacea canaliculata]|uniref:Dual specificity protein phosphatase 23 n=2 Tax=Pomacea canaliculata TaxID=400727 RepID=A0A2T7NRQ5_POMCA|nr:hypothetical protein C0Q70_17134 [Pomacea canaliculata]
MTTSPPHGDNSDNSFPSSETPEEGPEVGASLSGESGSLATPGNGDDSLEEEMPLNFSWVIVDLLCACGLPGTVANLRYLKNQGVTCIVSLTPEHHLPQHDMEGLEVVRIEVEDMTPPTLFQVHQFIEIVDKAKYDKTGVAVHCAAGKGRTGTMIACYFVHHMHISADEALDKIRSLRAGSVETIKQEECVRVFERSSGGPCSSTYPEESSKVQRYLPS